MKSLLVILATIMVFVMVPAITYGQAYQTDNGSPPISQPLVREGTVALRLVEALAIGNTTSEAEAESLLSSAGISPRNGWIADYPVTPDIAAEIRDAVAEAAASGSLKMDQDRALAAFDSDMNQYNLALRPDTSGETGAMEAESYSDPEALNNYYAEQGPPVVTYYEPPVAYASFYSWIPYPFWWWNVRFPGFFVLADFHRPFFFHGHRFFVSNHFSDRDDHRFRRIDADDRFREFHGRRSDDHGRHFVNKRVVGPSEFGKGPERAFRSEHNRAGFDADHSRTKSGDKREVRNASREINGDTSAPVSSTGKKFNSSSGRGGSVVSPSEKGRTFNPSRISAPSDGRRMTNPAAQRDFNPFVGGIRGGNTGGSFGGFGGRNKRM